MHIICYIINIILNFINFLKVANCTQNINYYFQSSLTYSTFTEMGNGMWNKMQKWQKFFKMKF